MKRVSVFYGVLVLAVMAASLDMAARAEWKSEPPEVMAGGEIIGQFYHLFSNAQPPHRVWVKYQDKIFFCRGQSKNFQCQESNENDASPSSVAIPPDGTAPPAP